MKLNELITKDDIGKYAILKSGESYEIVDFLDMDVVYPVVTKPNFNSNEEYSGDAEFHQHREDGVWDEDKEVSPNNIVRIVSFETNPEYFL